jgi:hypothetical protein
MLIDKDVLRLRPLRAVPTYDKQGGSKRIRHLGDADHAAALRPTVRDARGLPLVYLSFILYFILPDKGFYHCLASDLLH